MNCPSRTEESGREGWNQNPSALSADLTTRQDMNGIVNIRERHRLSDEIGVKDAEDQREVHNEKPHKRTSNEVGLKTHEIEKEKGLGKDVVVDSKFKGLKTAGAGSEDSSKGVHTPADGAATGPNKPNEDSVLKRLWTILKTYCKFIGPGFLVAVAYIDPGNYSTDVAAGSTFRFKLLFVILMSNIFAILLQTLCIRLGSITGLNLAENCKAHLPWWLNIVLYIFAEAAIIATDIAEVIGSAIALNLLLKVPLVAGCAITIIDVVIILLFYSPKGSLRRTQIFEYFVMALVFGVTICFAIQLSLIQNTSAAEVLRGYLPSSTLVQSQGLYLSCGILGATVMPHSLYLGSGVVQTRLLDFDRRRGHNVAADSQNPARNSSDLDDSESVETKYRPSLAAIKHCLTYSTLELAISLFTFALFVNSAILITAGASLSSNSEAQDADLFSIHDLLSKSLAPAAGTIFALALLLSGTSAGIICTIAGQMVSEGQLNWTMAPWMRRMITRTISITPSIIVAAAVGRRGLSAVLNGTQVALSVILPVVSAPLIYFTCRNRYMTVAPCDTNGAVPMRNHWSLAVLSVIVWLVIVIMNVALLVLVGLGKA